MVRDKLCFHECTVCSQLDGVVSDIRCVSEYTTCLGYKLCSRIYVVFTDICRVYVYTVCSEMYGVFTYIRCVKAYTICSHIYGVVTNIRCDNGHTVWSRM